jgi:hypothetical protein
MAARRRVLRAHRLSPHLDATMAATTKSAYQYQTCLRIRRVYVLKLWTYQSCLRARMLRARVSRYRPRPPKGPRKAYLAGRRSVSKRNRRPNLSTLIGNMAKGRNLFSRRLYSNSCRELFQPIAFSAAASAGAASFHGKFAHRAHSTSPRRRASTPLCLRRAMRAHLKAVAALAARFARQRGVETTGAQATP